jgi:hypothetical protein
MRVLLHCQCKHADAVIAVIAITPACAGRSSVAAKNTQFFRAVFVLPRLFCPLLIALKGLVC